MKRKISFWKFRKFGIKEQSSFGWILLVYSGLFVLLGIMMINYPFLDKFFPLNNVILVVSLLIILAIASFELRNISRNLRNK